MSRLTTPATVDGLALLDAVRRGEAADRAVANPPHDLTEEG